MKSTRTFAQKCTLMLSTVAVGGVLVAGAGCSSSGGGADVGSAPAATETRQGHVDLPHADFPAAPESLAADGVATWRVFQRGQSTVLVGRDAQGAVRKVVAMRVKHGTRGRGVVELRTGGGTFRAHNDGQVIENTLRPEHISTLERVNRDIARARASDAKVAYSECSDALIYAAVEVALAVSACSSASTVIGAVACASALSDAWDAGVAATAACSDPPPPPPPPPPSCDPNDECCNDPDSCDSCGGDACCEDPGDECCFDDSLYCF